MGKTKIEWADYTFNPWIGCTHVSEGCEHCFAERADHQYKWTKDGWGAGKPRKRTSEGYWKKPYTWNRNARMYKTRYKVFCGSLMDVFDPEVPQEWRDDAWYIMENTPLLDWQLLTKRPQNILDMIPEDWHTHWPKNVWVGVSVENQKTFDRILQLRHVYTGVKKFVSFEPLLEPLRGSLEGIDWIIVGAESGRYARHMNPDWAREIRDVCQASGIPFFMKQMSNRDPIPDDLMIREFPK